MDNITLHIDNRERSLIKQLEENHPDMNPLFSNLEIGDIQIRKDGVPIIIIERKTVTDLNASIMDGRYREQKYRLKSLASSKCRIIYLIEGWCGDAGKSRVLSVIVNTMIRDALMVYKTPNLEESVNFVRKIIKNLPKYVDQFGLSGDESCNNRGVVEYHLKSSKKGLMTHALCYKMQLSQIPGISQRSACAISELYPTMIHLIGAYDECEEGDKMLANVIVGKRRLGEKRSTAVYNFLHHHS